MRKDSVCALLRLTGRKPSAVANANPKMEPMDNHIKQITRKVLAATAHTSTLQNASTELQCQDELGMLWAEEDLLHGFYITLAPF